MSKNTKIIAIVGGLLIAVALGYTLFTKGGFGAALESMGCGGDAKKSAPPKALSRKELQWRDCQKWGWVAKRSKGAPFAYVNTKKVKVKSKTINQPVPDGGEAPAKRKCLVMWRDRCTVDKAVVAAYNASGDQKNCVGTTRGARIKCLDNKLSLCAKKKKMSSCKKAAFVSAYAGLCKQKLAEAAKKLGEDEEDDG